MSNPGLDTKLTEQPPVDETPISPVHNLSAERRNSLEHYLQNRPERDELVESCVPRVPPFPHRPLT